MTNHKKAQWTPVGRWQFGLRNAGFWRNRLKSIIRRNRTSVPANGTKTIGELSWFPAESAADKVSEFVWRSSAMENECHGADSPFEKISVLQNSRVAVADQFFLLTII